MVQQEWDECNGVVETLLPEAAIPEKHRTAQDIGNEVQNSWRMLDIIARHCDMLIPGVNELHPYRGQRLRMLNLFNVSVLGRSSPCGRIFVCN